MRVVLLLLFFAMFGAAGLASAGTLYVESYGQNNMDCSKSDPCRQIGHALMNAGTNDRVLVGPGIYNESQLLVGAMGSPVDGVKLQSVAGASSVLIYSNASPMLRVYGDRFVLGGKGKGLHFQATSPSELQVGAEINGEKAKVEGNFLDNQDAGASFNLAAGIRINNVDGKNTIRYNRVSGFSTALYLDIDDNSKSIVSENAFSLASYRCISIIAARGSDKINRNTLSRCSDAGIGNAAGVYIFLTNTDNTQASRPKIDRNRIINAGFGDGVSVSRARATVTRNLLSGLGRGVFLSNNEKTSITNNLIQNSDLGISLSGSTTDTVIQGNTQANLRTHVYLRNPIHTKVKSITRNNFLVDQGGGYCPIELQSANDQPGDPQIVFNRNFWGDLTDTFDFEPDVVNTADCILGGRAADTYAAGNLVFNNPATKPHPVKYRADGSY